MVCYGWINVAFTNILQGWFTGNGIASLPINYTKPKNMIIISHQDKCYGLCNQQNKAWNCDHI